METLHKKIIDSDVIRDMAKITTNEARIHCIFNFLAKQKLPPPKLHPRVKNSKQSEKFRQTAELVSTNRSDQFALSCDLYSRSIAFAPLESEQLARCYASRSKFLFKYRLYNECQRDIDKYLFIKLAKNRRKKLLSRPEQNVIEHRDDIYEKAMVAKISMKSIVNNIKNEKKEVEEENTNMEKERIFNLESESKIEMKYSEEFGRHIVASEDIKIGEVVAVEKAYALIPNPEQRYTNCWYCLDKCWTGIACDYCPDVVFCSDKCKLEAWEKFHGIECEIMEHVLNEVHKGLRIIIFAIRETGSIDKLMEVIREIDKHHDESKITSLENGKLSVGKYEHIYTLLTHENKRDPKFMAHAALRSAITTFLLATETTFFGEIMCKDWKNFAKNKYALFIGGLILKQHQIMLINNFSYLENVILSDKEILCPGSAVMPLFSRINHSCDPNVSYITKKGHLALIAVYPIVKGEQIFCARGPVYCFRSKAERQQIIENAFYFTCKCKACEENWPLFNDIKSYKDIIDSEDIKLKIDDSLNNFNNIVKKYHVDTETSLTFSEIIKELASMLGILYKYMKGPCKEIVDIKDLMMGYYWRLGNRVILPTLIDSQNNIKQLSKEII